MQLQPTNNLELIQETEHFAMWKVIYKGCEFLWPEAKRPWLEKAIGPNHQEIEAHYQYKLEKKNGTKNKQDRGDKLN